MKHVYTLEDLQQGDLPANAKLAVLGYPVKHSASPQMHQAALDALEIDATYIRLEIEPGKIAESFQLMQERGFIGCNVTVPHKNEAMAACTTLSESAEFLGAVNTVIYQVDGILGDNTDGPGLIKALETEFGISIEDSKILLLGAGGGAGKAIASQMAKSHCKSLYLSNRTESKVEALAQKLSTAFPTSCHTLDNSDDKLSEVAAKVDIIINATSLGMKDDDASPLPLASLSAKHKVYDAIYNPAETPLLKAAKDTGAATANGKSMLVYQGALSFEYWLGQAPSIELMKAAIS